MDGSGFRIDGEHLSRPERLNQIFQFRRPGDHLVVFFRGIHFFGKFPDKGLELELLEQRKRLGIVKGLEFEILDGLGYLHIAINGGQVPAQQDRVLAGAQVFVQLFFLTTPDPGSGTGCQWTRIPPPA